MNQPNTPTTAGRPGSAMEAPDLLFVLRRYAWLIVGGAILGTVVAGGLFTYFRRFSPKYTATVNFQVLPPPVRVATNENGQEPIANPEETGQFIKRQTDLVIPSQRLLEASLKREEFQHREGDPDPRRKSAWLEEHAANPMWYLKHRTLGVTGLVDRGAFQVSMTTRDPQEAARLVNAIAHEYMDFLKQQSTEQMTAHQEELNHMRQMQDGTVKGLQASLEEYRRTNDVPAVMALHTAELAMLQQMTSEMVKARGEMQAAQSMLDNLRSQDADSFKLSAEMEQWVEQGPAMSGLLATRRSLEQEMAGAIASRQAKAVQDGIQARMDKTDEQIASNRRDLQKQARSMMMSKAELDLRATTAQFTSLAKLTEDQTARLKELDTALGNYQTRVEELKTQQDLLLKLQQEYRQSQLQAMTDATRVHQMGDALPPDEISSPLWYTYIPIGTGSGLLLAFLTSYILVLVDTRVRTPRDITRVLQLPMLGFVPDESDDSAHRGELATAIRTSPASMIAESFRQIRSQLGAQTNGTPVNTFLVASIAPGGGATTVASNLATGMALNGLRVLLVDANFYRPGLQNIYDNIPASGLRDAIDDPAVLESAIVPCQSLSTLHLMGTGAGASAVSGEVFESRAFRNLVDNLKSRFEVVIFDGAPLNLVSDSLTLAGRVDGVIAVVRAGEVSRGTVSRVREQLRQVRANLLGFILNAAQTSAAGYFKENYRTFYRYAGNGGRQTAAVAGR